MEELIEKNMGLVLTIVNRFNPKNQTEKEDYIQAGRIGLWKALKNFNPAKGNVLSTYAWNPIRWEIIKEIRLIKNKYDSVNIEEHQHHGPLNSLTPFWEFIPSNLTGRESKVIQLKLEGYNLKEISSKLDCNRSHTKKTLQSAVSKIKETNNNE